MTKESAEPDPCADRPNDLMCYIMANYDASTMATGTTNLLYYHDENLEDGAEDGSYRYSGSNPNNYVCFGSNTTPCPAGNLYRIIGFMPVDVVTDSTTPVTTERQMLYKLIKNDYETSLSLNMASPGYAGYENPQYYEGPTGSYPSESVDGFYWSGSSNNSTNTWGLSTLNTMGLNTNAYATFSSTWQDKIANVIWKVGGVDSQRLYGNGNSYESLMAEINNSGELLDGYDYYPDCNTSGKYCWYLPSDNKVDYVAKIGMLYISDFAYAVPQTYWDEILGSYDDTQIRSNNWIYRGIGEFTITRDASNGPNQIVCIYETGAQSLGCSSNGINGVRRSFYLTKDTIIDRNSHTGTAIDPYRISL